MPQRLLPFAERIQTMPPWHPERRSHDWHELIVPIEGLYAVRLAGKEYECGPGDALVYPAHTLHETLRPNCETLQFYCCMWRSKETPEWLRPGVVPDPSGRLLFCAGWMWQIASRFVDPAVRRQERDRLRHLQGLIEQELQAAADGRLQAQYDRVARIMEHMQENLSEQNRIDQLARMIGVSDDWLILRFKERTGLTPYQYLQRLRLDKAAAMLTSTDLSLSVIAEAVGYASGSHLSNLLKRKTGRRPEDYRATARRPMASH